ncbi:MAG TPA: hypothetical protein VK789_07225 [Bryobacteraceae bacterium]|nr:hypothetical protein [Bryobacteraceae bacterium]
MARCMYCGVPTTVQMMGQPVCVVCTQLLNEGKPPRAWVQTKSQTDLSALIASDLELGFKFVEAAQSAGDQRTSSIEIKRAGEALHSARLFTSQVRDPNEWRRLQMKARELEEAIRDCSKRLV